MAEPGDALPSTDQLLALLSDPAVHVQRAITLVEQLRASSSPTTVPDDRFVTGEWVAELTAALAAALKAVERGKTGVETFRALLERGGLEFQPRGFAARDLALLDRSATMLRAVQEERDELEDVELLLNDLRERLDG